MHATATIAMNDADILNWLDHASDADLDAVAFGIIGFDQDGDVRRYNAYESRLSGLSPSRVLGYSLFTAVAPCMNNYLVASRFEDAAGAGKDLDHSMPYVFTLKMRPRKVLLRLVARAGREMRYVLVTDPV